MLNLLGWLPYVCKLNQINQKYQAVPLSGLSFCIVAFTKSSGDVIQIGRAYPKSVFPALCVVNDTAKQIAYELTSIVIGRKESKFFNSSFTGKTDQGNVLV